MFPNTTAKNEHSKQSILSQQTIRSGNLEEETTQDKKRAVVIKIILRATKCREYSQHRYNLSNCRLANFISIFIMCAKHNLDNADDLVSWSPKNKKKTKNVQKP